MKILLKHVNEVEPSEVLAEDIYIDELLLVKKGTKLSKSLLQSLKRRKIDHVKTYFGLPNEEFAHRPVQEIRLADIAINNQRQAVRDEQKAKKSFVQTLSLIGHEHRLGKLLNRNEDVQFLTDLFINIHKKHSFIDLLYSLRNWDHYTFYHSFDVFIIGTILAKKHGIQNIETAALGYLLHDVGKLTISPQLLNKQRKLTLSEFEQVKMHTIEGEATLRSLGQHQIAHFARSHHERIDGSGYPDCLSGNEMPKELKILQLVDVYSALTLHRSYKKEMPAHEAIQILFRDKNLFDSELMVSLIDSLKIYPVASTVLLTNNQRAKIKNVHQHLPTIPDVTLLNHEEKFQLPLDYSITVAKMLKYESKSFQNSFHNFINFIISGSKQQMLEEFYYLIDGLRLEEVYLKVIMPAYWNLVKLHHLNVVAFSKFHPAIEAMIDLLDDVETEIMKSHEYKQKVLFIMNEMQDSRLQVKVLFHLLQIECIFPLLVSPGISNEDLKRFLIKNEINEICLVDLEAEQIQAYANLQAEGFHVYKKTGADLNALLMALNADRQPPRIFERLFGRSELELINS